MKKKIFVCMTGAMELGGVERSLLGLFDVIDYDKYEVDLFLYGHHGSLFQDINPHVHILPEIKELAYLRESLKTKIKQGAWYSVWRRVIDGLRHVGNDASWGKIVKKCVPNFSDTYDLAISFFLPFDVIRDKVRARVKLGWIHTDYSKHKTSLEYLRKAYSGVDYRVAVSDASREAFVTVLPEYEASTIVIENILPKSLILQQANAFDGTAELKKQGRFALLSIGRYTYAKNFDNIPAICSKLLEMGLSVTWFIIGFGTDEALIRQKIAEYGMEEHVILLGKKENPYPYIAACDLYVQPSRYEGKCVSVREAQMLGKPVVITDYPTSGSQLENGVDGIVVPQELNACAEGIAEVIKDRELQEKLIENCKARDYSGREEVEKIYALIGNECN